MLRYGSPVYLNQPTWDALVFSQPTQPALFFGVDSANRGATSFTTADWLSGNTCQFILGSANHVNMPPGTPVRFGDLVFLRSQKTGKVFSQTTYTFTAECTGSGCADAFLLVDSNGSLLRTTVQVGQPFYLQAITSSKALAVVGGAPRTPNAAMGLATPSMTTSRQAWRAYDKLPASAAQVQAAQVSFGQVCLQSDPLVCATVHSDLCKLGLELTTSRRTCDTLAMPVPGAWPLNVTPSPSTAAAAASATQPAPTQSSYTSAVGAGASSGNTLGALDPSLSVPAAPAGALAYGNLLRLGSIANRVGPGLSDTEHGFYLSRTPVAGEMRVFPDRYAKGNPMNGPPQTSITQDKFGTDTLLAPVSLSRLPGEPVLNNDVISLVTVTRGGTGVVAPREMLAVSGSVLQRIDLSDTIHTGDFGRAVCLLGTNCRRDLFVISNPTAQDMSPVNFGTAIQLRSLVDGTFITARVSDSGNISVLNVPAPANQWMLERGGDDVRDAAINMQFAFLQGDKCGNGQSSDCKALLRTLCTGPALATNVCRSFCRTTDAAGRQACDDRYASFCASVKQQLAGYDVKAYADACACINDPLRDLNIPVGGPNTACYASSCGGQTAYRFARDDELRCDASITTCGQTMSLNSVNQANLDHISNVCTINSGKTPASGSGTAPASPASPASDSGDSGTAPTSGTAPESTLQKYRVYFIVGGSVGGLVLVMLIVLAVLLLR